MRERHGVEGNQKSRETRKPVRASRWEKCPTKEYEMSESVWADFWVRTVDFGGRVGNRWRVAGLGSLHREYPRMVDEVRRKLREL